MAAQFFSSLADNALFIAAIALIQQLNSPAWMEPAVKTALHIAYVVLAAFVGAFADSFPKGRVMFSTNAIKVIGCVVIFFYDFVNLPGNREFWVVFGGYLIVGIGAAAYSPAKYGIVTELLPPEQLVRGNGWIEGLTVLSIILGTVLGGALISPAVSAHLLAVDVPHLNTGIDTPPEAAIVVIGCIYAIAAGINLFIPDTGARYPRQPRNPFTLLREFSRFVRTLWTDKLGQISLAVTTLFWGAGATLQVIVIEWGKQQLGLPLSKASMLMGIASVGTIGGAVLAGRFVALRRALTVLPFGVAMGLIVMVMPLTHHMTLVVTLMTVIGGLGGYFVVPMNALLQHRGHVLLSAGHSIAVQNFNEQISILVMLATYAALLGSGMRVNTIIVLFGLWVAGIMLLIMRWNHLNHRRDPHLDATIGDAKH
jgi:MFS family permease